MTKKPSPPPQTLPQAEAEAKPELRPANENPWYLLATYHGKPAEKDDSPEAMDIRYRNRMLWNGFVLHKYNKQNNKGLDKFFFEKENFITPYSDSEMHELSQQFFEKFGIDIPNSEFIDFSNLIFDDCVNFSGFIFPIRTNINNSIFNRNFLAKNSVFSEDLTMIKTEFKDNSSFIGSKFNSYSEFQGSIYRKDISFTKTIFNYPLYLAGAMFQRSPPFFDGASFQARIEFHGITWPPPPKDRVQAQGDINAYRHLKYVMESQKRHDDELFFFSKELECQQVIDGPWRGWPTKLYGLFSDYGASIAKPVRWLGVLVFVAFLFLLGTEECPLKEGKYCAPGTETHLLPMGKALGLAAASVVGLLPIKKDVFGETGQAFSAAAHVIMGVEALFGALLLFLLGLALRNRFRMK